MKDQRTEYLFNSGAEVNVATNIWVVFSAGGRRDNETGKWDIVTNFPYYGKEEIWMTFANAPFSDSSAGSDENSKLTRADCSEPVV